MSIEDVHHLLANSVEQEFVMFIDSSQRNKMMHPLPNNYSVIFSEPFKNVVGFNVLHCLVPRAMFNVDAHNNTLCLRFVGEDWKYITLMPKDYNLDNLAPSLTAACSDVLGPGRIVVRSAMGNDVRSTGSLQFMSSRPFEIDHTASTIHEVIGLDELFISSRDGTNYTVMSPTICRSVRQTAQGNERIYKHDSGLTMTKTSLNQMRRPVISLSEDAEIETITVTSATIRKVIVKDLVTENVLGEFTGQDRQLHGLVFVTAGQRVMLEAVSDADEVDVLVSAEPVSQWIGNGGQETFVVAVKTCRPTYKVIPPGLVCLTGERCVLLRCAEVEQHIGGSFMYGMNSPGISLITLAVQGYSTQRMDFLSIKYNNFHPVGKLSQISLRFETSRGDLYDFKGLNHTLVVGIRYLTPKPTVNFDNKILNANYNPDFLAYMLEHQMITDKLNEQAVEKEEIDEFYEARYEGISDASGSDSEVEIE